MSATAAAPVSVRRRCLHGLQAALAASRLDSLYVRARGIRGTTILMYHSVAGGEAADWIDPRNRVDPARFERQVAFLARHRSVVSVSDLAGALQEGRDLPAGTVVLTFDDGYLDNLTVAAPILARHDLPAALYLATGYVARGEPQWIDRLHGFFRTRTRDRLELPGRPPEGFDLRDPQAGRRAYGEASALLLSAGFEEREAMLSDWEGQLGAAGRPPRLTLTWEDARDLIRRFPRWEIGGHTRGHVDLSAHGPERAGLEIAGCAEDLRRELGLRADHFSFPYGRSTPDAVARVRQCGFRSATASGAECLITGGSDRFALARIDPLMSLLRLRFVTSGAYPALSRGLVGRA